MKKRTIEDYLQDMLIHIEKAEKFEERMTFDEFADDDKTVFAVFRAIEVIGEAIKQIPDSLRAKNPQIPWKSSAGMRDMLIHAYFGVELKILWDTSQTDLQQLRPII